MQQHYGHVIPEIDTVMTDAKNEEVSKINRFGQKLDPSASIITRIGTTYAPIKIEKHPQCQDKKMWIALIARRSDPI